MKIHHLLTKYTKHILSIGLFILIISSVGLILFIRSRADTPIESFLLPQTGESNDLIFNIFIFGMFIILIVGSAAISIVSIITLIMKSKKHENSISV